MADGISLTAGYQPQGKAGRDERRQLEERAPTSPLIPISRRADVLALQKGERAEASGRKDERQNQLSQAKGYNLRCHLMFAEGVSRHSRNACVQHASQREGAEKSSKRRGECPNPRVAKVCAFPAWPTKRVWPNERRRRRA